VTSPQGSGGGRDGQAATRLRRLRRADRPVEPAALLPLPAPTQRASRQAALLRLRPAAGPAARHRPLRPVLPGVPALRASGAGSLGHAVPRLPPPGRAARRPTALPALRPPRLSPPGTPAGVAPARGRGRPSSHRGSAPGAVGCGGTPGSGCARRAGSATPSGRSSVASTWPPGWLPEGSSRPAGWTPSSPTWPRGTASAGPARCSPRWAGCWRPSRPAGPGGAGGRPPTGPLDGVAGPRPGGLLHRPPPGDRDRPGRAAGRHAAPTPHRRRTRPAAAGGGGVCRLLAASPGACPPGRHPPAQRPHHRGGPGHRARPRPLPR
jgi:hypothetical protein